MSVSVMVFDGDMNPIWCDTPEKTARWLRYQIKNRPRSGGFRGCVVRISWPQEHLSVSEYLDRHPVAGTEGAKQ